MMRKTVAGEKSLQPNDAARIGGPDQHRAADPALDQADTAQDERAHDALAKIGFGDQQRAQSLRRNQKRLDVALGMAIDQRDAARELADFGKKLTGPLIDDRRDVTEAIALGDRDMAGQDHEHPRSGLAGLEQRFAILVTAHLAEPAHARDLLRRQFRECLLKTRKRGCSRKPSIRLAFSRGIDAHFFSRYSNQKELTGMQPAGSGCRFRATRPTIKDFFCVANPAICPASFRCRHVGRRQRHRKVRRSNGFVPSPAIFAASDFRATPASADPALGFSQAFRFAPRVYPCHPASWTRSIDQRFQIRTSRRIDRWANTMHWNLCRNGPWTAGIALSRPPIATCWPPCCRNILCFARRSCNRRSPGARRPCWC